jgi:hypothetical protein
LDDELGERFALLSEILRCLSFNIEHSANGGLNAVNAVNAV